MISKNSPAKIAAREKQWQQKIHAWEQSGLSQAKFSKLHGINPGTFSYWKRRLQDKNEAGQKNDPSFLPLSVIQKEPTPPISGKSGLTVTIQSRFTININEQFSSRALFQIVQVLEEL